MSASSSFATRRIRRSGFTLIELMIAVAIVAILLGVALPSFMDSMRKSRRSEAFNAIAQTQQAQERWRSGNAAYSTDFGELKLTASSASSYTTPKGYYTLTVAAVSNLAVDYEVTATAAGSQASDTLCAVMKAKVEGGKVLYGGGGSSSFDYNDPNRCWAR